MLQVRGSGQMRAARESAETACQVPCARLSPSVCAEPAADELAILTYFSKDCGERCWVVYERTQGGRGLWVGVGESEPAGIGSCRKEVQNFM